MLKFLSEPAEAETETDDGTRAEAAASAALSEQAAGGGGGGGGKTGEGVTAEGYWRSHHPALDGRSDRHPADTHAAREKGEGEQAAAGRAGPVAFGGLQRALADRHPATAGAGGSGTGATQSPPPAGVTSSHVAASAASAPAGLPLSAGARNVRVHLGFCASLQVGGVLTPSDTDCE